MAAEFPKSTIEQALAVPMALQKNAGQPMDAISLATALGISPGSSGIRKLTASSSAYGLTGGGLKSRVSMGALGTKYTSPRQPGEELSAVVEATLTPELFMRVFNFYKGKKYPEPQFMANTLRLDFEVPENQASTFVGVFTKNMEFAGLLRNTKGGLWLVSEVDRPVQQGEEVADRSPGDGVDGDDEGEGEGEAEIVIPASRISPPAALPTAKAKRPNKIFIGHGKNKKPLEQLTAVLRDLGIPHIVAETEPNLNRPISKKVRDSMELCGAAILIFSADEQYFDEDANPLWKPSENVSNELGAASVLYEDRVIMFKESSIKLASNYSGIGYIEFDHDNLDAKTNELFRELIGLKILRVSLDE